MENDLNFRDMHGQEKIRKVYRLVQLNVGWRMSYHSKR
uniref:Uncharacterized protein n=1 Tax=Siphoviridae sp. ctX5W26 TaxID=2825540 RepID=A0A8S5UEI7_9CAUD|nr:MAG TPA: hypothetical protein [Siphoviridae sp. ctX5W26]